MNIFFTVLEEQTTAVKNLHKGSFLVSVTLSLTVLRSKGERN